jgi:hypothetical protein
MLKLTTFAAIVVVISAIAPTSRIAGSLYRLAVATGRLALKSFGPPFQWELFDF